MSWSDKINKLVESGKHDLGKLSRAIKIELFTDIVSNTRVDTGRLKGNWQIQENEPAKSEIDRIDKTGGVVNAEIERGATANGVTYFTNNLPYAKKYEEIDGMVINAVNRVKANLDDMVNEL